MALPVTFALISSSSTPWLWPMVGAAAGVYLFYHGFQLLQRKRLIENTPTSKIRSAAMGLVELSGLANGPYTMTAPITGVPCYLYRTMVWQWKRQGKGNTWVKVVDEGLHLPFFLDDGTARVLVNPQGAELEIHRDFQDEIGTAFFSTGLEAPTNVGNFLLMHGVSNDKKVKIEEYCIKPKNALFILGTLAENPGVSVSATPVRTIHGEHTASLNLGSVSLSSMFSQGDTVSFGYSHVSFPSGEAATHQPHLDPAQQSRIAEVLTKAGITNPAAWAAAGLERGRPASQAVAGAAASPAPAVDDMGQYDQHPRTVMMKGSHNPAFMISWRSQRDILGSLQWQSALMIWGGPALALLCIYILAGEFGWL